MRSPDHGACHPHVERYPWPPRHRLMSLEAFPPENAPGSGSENKFQMIAQQYDENEDETANEDKGTIMYHVFIKYYVDDMFRPCHDGRWPYNILEQKIWNVFLF